jgi:hypothetical protein
VTTPIPEPPNGSTPTPDEYRQLINEAFGRTADKLRKALDEYAAKRKAAGMTRRKR